MVPFVGAEDGTVVVIELLEYTLAKIGWASNKRHANMAPEFREGDESMIFIFV